MRQQKTEMITKAKKIEIIKALLTGKKKLFELRPMKYVFITSNDREPGIYRNEETGEVLNQEQFDKIREVKDYSIFHWIEFKSYGEDPKTNVTNGNH